MLLLSNCTSCVHLDFPCNKKSLGGDDYTDAAAVAAATTTTTTTTTTTINSSTNFVSRQTQTQTNANQHHPLQCGNNAVSCSSFGIASHKQTTKLCDFVRYYRLLMNEVAPSALLKVSIFRNTPKDATPEN